MSKKRCPIIQKNLGEHVTTEEKYTSGDFELLNYHEFSRSGSIDHADGATSEITVVEESDRLLHHTEEWTDVWNYKWDLQTITEKRINYEKFLGTWKNANGVYTLGALYDPDGKEVGYGMPDDPHAIGYPALDIAEEQWQNIDELIYILGNHSDTQMHQLLMMYYWNIYEGKDIYDVDLETLLNLFDTGAFIVVNEYGSGAGPSYGTIVGDITNSDIELIARTVYAERGGGTQEQQEYVASVILNRVLSSVFPNTVLDVISAKGQFSSYNNKNFRSDGYKNEVTQAAVRNVIANGDTTGGAVYFMTPEAAASQSWLNNCKFLFNDETGKKKPTILDRAWKRTHNFYTTEVVQLELSQYVGGYDDIIGGGTVVSTDGCVQYYQTDYAHIPYGKGTIASSGCGITSCSMVISTLLGKQVTPADMVNWCGNKFYVFGIGTSWSLYKEAARYYQVGTVTQTGNIETAKKALKQGKLVICSQGKGLFTNGAHVIVLYKMEGENIFVKDPNKKNAINKGYNGRGFSTEEIKQAAHQYFIFNGEGRRK